MDFSLEVWIIDPGWESEPKCAGVRSLGPRSVNM